MKASEKAMGDVARKRPLMVDDYEATLIRKFMEWLVTPGQKQFMDRYMEFTDSEYRRARKILMELEARKNA